MARNKDEHEYGGMHTERKLKIITEYAKMYRQVLHQFTAWYVDAFAGTGDRIQKVPGGGLLEGTPIREDTLTFEGSARRVLGIEPPFHHYRMIESMLGRSERLKQLEAEYPDRDVQCSRGDGNEFIKRLFSEVPWTARFHQNRALVFLDPYGLGVEWSTLEVLAASKAADVWLFFNLGGLNRQIARSTARVDASKRASLTRMFGNEDWLGAFFAPARQSDLLDMVDAAKDERKVDREAVLAYAKQRYSEVFCFVPPPIIISKSGEGGPYAMFCMSNNPSRLAQGAIGRLVNQVRRLV